VEISEPLKNQCKHFIECVAERGRPLSGGPEGRDVVRVLEGLDISLRNNGAPVQLWSDKKYEFEEKQAAATVR